MQGPPFLSALEKLSNALNSLEHVQARDVLDKKKLYSAAEAAEACAEPSKPAPLVVSAPDTTCLRVSEQIFLRFDENMKQRHAFGLDGQLAELKAEKQQWRQSEQEMNGKLINLSKTLEDAFREFEKLRMDMHQESAHLKDLQRHLKNFTETEVQRFAMTQKSLDEKLNAMLNKQEQDQLLETSLEAANSQIQQLSKNVAQLQREKANLEADLVDAKSKAAIATQTLEEARAYARVIESDWISACQKLILQNQAIAESKIAANEEFGGTIVNSSKDAEVEQLVQDLERAKTELAQAKKLLQEAATFDQEAIEQTAKILKEMI